jgi:hypothetical protein
MPRRHRRSPRYLLCDVLGNEEQHRLRTLRRQRRRRKEEEEEEEAAGGRVDALRVARGNRPVIFEALGRGLLLLAAAHLRVLWLDRGDMVARAITIMNDARRGEKLKQKEKFCKVRFPKHSNSIQVFIETVFFTVF